MSIVSTDPTATDVPAIRRTDGLGVLSRKLGPLADLPGLWIGSGFNLIARPDFAARTQPPTPTEPAHLFLELNFTVEALKFDTIGSPIPNRGFDSPTSSCSASTTCSRSATGTPVGRSISNLGSG